jgi:hypothetical protein
VSAGAAVERLSDALTAHGSTIQQNNGRIMAQCPAHDDHNPSLSIRGTEGQALVYCFAGCRTGDVLAALDLTEADLYDEKSATYRYEDGRTVRRRYDKDGHKRFAQTGQRPGVVQLYRLSRVVRAVQDAAPIYLVEGEKDVHALESAGGVATTAPMGATNFDKVDVAPLRGAIVIAVVDRDAAGDRWATTVRERLDGFAASLAFVEAITGKDAADHVAAGHGLADFAPRQPLEHAEIEGIHSPSDLWEGAVGPEGFPYEPSVMDEEYADAVSKTRAKMGGEAPDAEAEEYVQQRYPSVDWPAAFQTDFSQIDWLPGRFMERGQQVGLVGDGKVGKSLFMLDWAWRTASGRSFLGDKRHEPMRVLYFDRENSLRDITTRALSLGATAADLENLIYKQFPGFPGSLDASHKAAKDLLALVEFYRADVIVIDTVSRFISGKENDSDTWLQLYQAIHVPLKSAGIACLRLDHFGKDTAQGSRGSSAKTQDVDHVWELSALKSEKVPSEDGGVEVLTTTLKLHRSHTRSGLGEETFAMIRRGERQRGGAWLPGRTRHELTDNGVVAEAAREVSTIVQALIDGGCPTAGREIVKRWMGTHGMFTPSNATMSEVIKEMKARNVH